MACYELYQQVQSRFGFFSYFYSNEGNRGRQQEMLKKRGGKRGSIEEMEHQSSPTGRHGPSKEQRGEISIACSTENCTYVLHTLCRFTAVPMMPYEKNKENLLRSVDVTKDGAVEDLAQLLPLITALRIGK